MDYKDTLYEARALIEDKSRWTCNVSARTAEGLGTQSTAPDAVCWCATGAIEKVLYDCNHTSWVSCTIDYILRLDNLVKKLYPHLERESAPTVYVNDTYGHVAMLHVLDVALQS